MQSGQGEIRRAIAAICHFADLFGYAKFDRDEVDWLKSPRSVALTTRAKHCSVAPFAQGDQAARFQ